MEHLKILIGLLALVLAWLFLFRNRLIFTINAWMREHVFSDKLVLISGRRVAALLLVLGVVALFSGLEDVTDLVRIRPKIAANILDQARQDFRSGRYVRVVTRCKELIRSDPNNAEAWEMLAGAWWALGEKEKAAQAVESLLRINPEHPLKSGSLAQFVDRRRQERQSDRRRR